MSAKALAACSFEPAAEQRAATDHQAPEGLAAEIQFRADLWVDSMPSLQTNRKRMTLKRILFAKIPLLPYVFAAFKTNNAPGKSKPSTPAENFP